MIAVSQGSSDFVFAVVVLAIVAARLLLWALKAVGCWSYSAAAPTGVGQHTPADVTVLCIVGHDHSGQLHDNLGMKEALRSWAANDVAEIVLVVQSESDRQHLQQMAALAAPTVPTRVVISEDRDRRRAVIAGIKAARTRFLCFADLDAVWNRDLVTWLLRPLSDPDVAATAPSRIMRPRNVARGPTLCERVADMRASGAMVAAAASAALDGSYNQLPGGTALVRRKVLNDAFAAALLSHDHRRLTATELADFLSRWIYCQELHVWPQLCRPCTAATIFPSGGSQVADIVDFSRSTARTDLRRLCTLTTWLGVLRAPLVLDRLLLAPLLQLLELAAFAALLVVAGGWGVVEVCVYAGWVLLFTALRLAFHFVRCPGDILFFPALLAADYMIAVLHLYALLTLFLPPRQDALPPEERPDKAEEPHVRVSLGVAEDGLAALAFRSASAADVQELRSVHKKLARDGGTLPPTALKVEEPAGPVIANPRSPASSGTPAPVDGELSFAVNLHTGSSDPHPDRSPPPPRRPKSVEPRSESPSSRAARQSRRSADSGHAAAGRVSKRERRSHKKRSASHGPRAANAAAPASAPSAAAAAPLTAATLKQLSDYTQNAARPDLQPAALHAPPRQQAPVWGRDTATFPAFVAARPMVATHAWPHHFQPPYAHAAAYNWPRAPIAPPPAVQRAVALSPVLAGPPPPIAASPDPCGSPSSAVGSSAELARLIGVLSSQQERHRQLVDPSTPSSPAVASPREQSPRIEDDRARLDDSAPTFAADLPAGEPLQTFEAAFATAERPADEEPQRFDADPDVPPADSVVAELAEELEPSASFSKVLGDSHADVDASGRSTPLLDSIEDGKLLPRPPSQPAPTAEAPAPADAPPLPPPTPPPVSRGRKRAARPAPRELPPWNSDVRTVARAPADRKQSAPPKAPKASTLPRPSNFDAGGDDAGGELALVSNAASSTAVFAASGVGRGRPMSGVTAGTRSLSLPRRVGLGRSRPSTRLGGRGGDAAERGAEVAAGGGAERAPEEEKRGEGEGGGGRRTPKLAPADDKAASGRVRFRAGSPCDGRVGKGGVGGAANTSVGSRWR